MFKKFGIGMLAIVLAATFSAFTAPAKPARSATSMDLYWYKVTNNQIPNANAFHDYGEQTAISTPPCDPGSNRDCLRGFQSQLDFSNGPVTAVGAEQIKTDDPQ